MNLFHNLSKETIIQPIVIDLYIQKTLLFCQLGDVHARLTHDQLIALSKIGELFSKLGAEIGANTPPASGDQS